ncbi:cell wall-binding repeat-containing protein [Mobiluncus curtisii]|uniref:cell wall-binding repeat-containing protein n=1 Tax=Mobiluncus curtisii TaxID=2051 RepID=UPI0014707C4C|nr:cell wall-binding repeat-containing protein [Mobiluncus curtisii]MCV0021224.1 cell wall-binding repeat-containing protein [Mobiluncus curtisii]NMW48212.1 cell wall-binding repeat-containing protein [Mobiluncus curtisii]
MNRKFVAALSCLALAGTGVGIAQAAPKTDSIGGIDRYDTAVQIAARTFTGHQDTVYIARGDLPVDALVAGQLTDGPVLLSPLGQVNPRTLQALQGYSPKEIIFLGKAFPASTINTYKTSGAQAWVMGGKDRQETSALIAGRAFNGKSLYHLYVAAPDGVDAVASGALTDAPIVLAYPNGRVPSVAGLPADTARVCIGAACNYVSAKERVQGKDRFETAELLAKRAFPNGFTRAYVGRSDNFIDAVVGGTLTDAPILLVHPSGQGNDRINALNLAHVTFLGGPGALPDNVLTLKPQPKPTSGLGLPWAGKINPLFAGTGAFGPFVFSEYVEAYSWTQIAGLYGWSANLSAEDAVAKLQTQGIVASRSVTNENWTVQSVIFDKNWRFTPDKLYSKGYCNGKEVFSKGPTDVVTCPDGSKSTLYPYGNIWKPTQAELEKARHAYNTIFRPIAEKAAENRTEELFAKENPGVDFNSKTPSGLEEGKLRMRRWLNNLTPKDWDSLPGETREEMRRRIHAKGGPSFNLAMTNMRLSDLSDADAATQFGIKLAEMWHGSSGHWRTIVAEMKYGGGVTVALQDFDAVFPERGLDNLTPDEGIYGISASQSGFKPLSEWSN